MSKEDDLQKKVEFLDDSIKKVGSNVKALNLQIIYVASELTSPFSVSKHETEGIKKTNSEGK